MSKEIELYHRVLRSVDMHYQFAEGRAYYRGKHAYQLALRAASQAPIYRQMWNYCVALSQAGKPMNPDPQVFAAEAIQWELDNK